jgi:hypothetical protein
VDDGQEEKTSKDFFQQYWCVVSLRSRTHPQCHVFSLSSLLPVDRVFKLNLFFHSLLHTHLFKISSYPRSLRFFQVVSELCSDSGIERCASMYSLWPSESSKGQDAALHCQPLCTICHVDGE